MNHNKITEILILNPYLPTLGGGEKNMGYLCQFLEERYKYVKIDILVHDYNDIDIYDKDYVSIDQLNKKFDLKLRHTSILKIDLNPEKGMLGRLRNKRKIEKITKNYDIFINNMFMSRHAGLAKKNMYICMFPPRRYSDEYTKGVRHWIGKVLDRYFYRSYDVFVSNSEFTNHWLSYFWWKNEKNRIIYPPTFWEYEIEGRYNEEKKKNIIISVGRFFVAAHSKKQLEMAEIFAKNIEKLGDYEYHLVGSVSNYKQDIEYLNKVREIAERSKKIYIHENCTYGDLVKLYSQAKIFWHATGYNVDENKEPEKMEHFGITTVEAMSFGTVPVVINKGGQRETVIEGKNGYLWNNEVECIKKTTDLILNEEKRKEMAVKAVERAFHFSVDEFFRANRRVFNEYGM